MVALGSVDGSRGFGRAIEDWSFWRCWMDSSCRVLLLERSGGNLEFVYCERCLQCRDTNTRYLLAGVIAIGKTVDAGY